jgi:hypothetical protein
LGAYTVSPLRAPGREAHAHKERGTAHTHKDKDTAHTDSTSTETERVRERQHTQRERDSTHTERKKSKGLDKLHKHRDKHCAICELDNTEICGIM